MLPPSLPTKAEWPPNYLGVWQWRQQQLFRMRADPRLIKGAKEYYATNYPAFITHWVDTYDPRNAFSGKPTKMPFLMFPRQVELIEFFNALLKGEESGLIEKARDMGATWVAAAYSVCLWLFLPGSAVGWGSRKEALVDKLGDADSIFEKIRIIIRGLPPEFLPAGFRYDDHMPFMRIINPENYATITGEGGDNIGRGGRKLIYFKDESAHYERPEKIEAALADNTRVQVDISSVNGIGNVFYRRRQAGVEWTGGDVIPKKTNLFIMDWSDHPAKDQEWFDARKSKAEGDGLYHIFAQEVERNYEASVQGRIIKLEWVRAAIDAHKKLGLEETGGWTSGLDVADEGPDRPAWAARRGIILKEALDWIDRDAGAVARNAVLMAEGKGPIDVQYDCIGVGAAVKAEINRLKDGGADGETLLDPAIAFQPWNAAAKPLDPKSRVIPDDPESPLNEDFFHNIKAQGWWQLGRRFQRTYQAIVEGIQHDPADLISIPSDLPALRTIEKELCQPTIGKSPSTMKLLVNKTPEGTTSPNIADAIMQCYWPIPAAAGFAWTVGGKTYQ